MYINTYQCHIYNNVTYISIRVNGTFTCKFTQTRKDVTVRHIDTYQYNVYINVCEYISMSRLYQSHILKRMKRHSKCNRLYTCLCMYASTFPHLYVSICVSIHVYTLHVYITHRENEPQAGFVAQLDLFVCVRVRV